MKIYLRDRDRTLLIDETQIESVISEPKAKNLRIRMYSGDTLNLDLTLPSVEAAWEYLATKASNAVAANHYSNQLEKFQALTSEANGIAEGRQ